MRKSHWTLRFAVYTVFFLAIAWDSLVVLSKLVLYRAEVPDRTWVPDM